MVKANLANLRLAAVKRLLAMDCTASQTDSGALASLQTALLSLLWADWQALHPKIQVCR